MLADVGGDRLEKMRLPEPRPAVDEERVVRLRRRLCDRQRRRVGEAVGRPDDEVVERVLRVGTRGNLELADPRRRGGDRLGRALDDAGCSSATVRTTRISRPRTSRTAARTKPRKCPSIHSLVKSFGRLTEKESSVSSPAAAAPNQVAYVVSLSASRSRCVTSSQRAPAESGVSGCKGSRALLGRRGEGEHTNRRRARNTQFYTARESVKTPVLQGDYLSPQ